MNWHATANASLAEHFLIYRIYYVTAEQYRRLIVELKCQGRALVRDHHISCCKQILLVRSQHQTEGALAGNNIPISLTTYIKSSYSEVTVDLFHIIFVVYAVKFKVLQQHPFKLSAISTPTRRGQWMLFAECNGKNSKTI